MPKSRKKSKKVDGFVVRRPAAGKPRTESRALFERILRQTATIAADLFGEGHPFHRRAVEQLAESLRRRGRDREADAILRRLEGRRQRSTDLPDSIGAAAPPGSKARPPAARPALLDIRQAARHLTVSRETLYKLVRSGEIPHVRVGRSIRIRPAEIERYLTQRDTRTWTRVDGRGRPASPASRRRRDDSPE